MAIVSLPLFALGQNGLFVNDTLPAKDNCGKITTLDCRLDTIKTDSYGLEKVEINGNHIEFFVNYNCGCGKSNFELVKQKNIIGSQGIDLKLIFKSNDSCKAMCDEKVSFDLSPYLSQATTKEGFTIKISGTKYELKYKK